VWLGNVRGNIYCMNHTTLTPKKHEFWDFSFQEMAEIDLPAMVDYVLKVRFERYVLKLFSIKDRKIVEKYWESEVSQIGRIKCDFLAGNLQISSIGRVAQWLDHWLSQRKVSGSNLSAALSRGKRR
jgi:hypothetical protein